MAYDKEKLWYFGYEPATCRIQHQRGESVTNLLSSRDWGLRERSALAVVLAHVVLHCSESSWLDNNWSKDHLMFFKKESAEPEFDRPFLIIDFERESAESVQNSPKGLHPNPTILALGILLLEIYTRTTIESLRKVEYLSGGQTNPNTDLTTAIKVLDERQGDPQVRYRQAVRECLFWKIGDRGDDGHVDMEEQRRKIYEKVVVPLELELRDGFPGNDSLCAVCG